MPDQEENQTSQQLTAAEAAKRVQRVVYEQVDAKGQDDKPVKKLRAKRVAVDASEVLDFREYEDRVIVVTTDGQKLSSAER